MLSACWKNKTENRSLDNVGSMTHLGNLEGGMYGSLSSRLAPRLFKKRFQLLKTYEA